MAHQGGADGLALAARAIAYAEKIEFSGPQYAQQKVEGDKVVLSGNAPTTEQLEKIINGILAREGATTYLEVGPGRVLTGLLKRTLDGARGLSVEDPASLDQAVQALGGGAA